MTSVDTARAHAGQAVSAVSNPGLIVVFLMAVVTPVAFEAAGLRLSPIRIFLLAMIIPYAAQVLSGKFGGITRVDIMFLLHGLWIIVALVAVHGTQRILFAGITAVELVGGYFVGRALIRSAADYRFLIRVTLIAILCLMPFAIYENFTGKMVLPDLLRPIFDTPVRADSAYGRMGLERTYVVFDHPILWGVFCSLMLANLVVMVRNNVAKIIGAILFVSYATMLSLSSAPLLSCAVQLGMLTWGWIMGGRWKLLIILTISGYVIVDLLSDRTPITILIETMTFNPMSGWIRIAIFDYGWAAAQRSPIFGIGFNDWPRPHWLTSSVDNFWLLAAMRYGMIGAILIIAAFLLHIVALMRAKVADPDVAALRIGYTIALVGIAFTLVTVHAWGAVSVFIMFYLGAGAWLYTTDQSETDISEQPARNPREVSYTRFPQSAMSSAGLNLARGKP